MSTHVVGFRPTDEKWKKMKSAWDACKEAGILPPSEVTKFFDGVYPGDKPGMEVNLGEALLEWRGDSEQGFEVDIDKLPKDVRWLRFYNSW